jgi:hypothetical protein
LSRHGSWLSSLLLLAALGCERDAAPGLAKERAMRPKVLRVREYFPKLPETEAAGSIERRIVRGGPGFSRLVRSDSELIVFKDEEKTGADRMMSPELRARLLTLARLVKREWPELELRVTEAWDEDGELGKGSLHYVGRAVDVTTSDVDATRLGRLAGLAIEAGFDWVYREQSHVHASLRD